MKGQSGPRESVEWTRRLAEVGIFAGISSGAIMAAAVKCAAEIDEGVIVTIVCDSGWKYLSTGVWTDDIDEVTARAKRVIYFCALGQTWVRWCAQDQAAVRGRGAARRFDAVTGRPPRGPLFSRRLWGVIEVAGRGRGGRPG